MHEMSLGRSMLEIIEAQALHGRFTRVNTIRLGVGALSCVEPSALKFCFEAVARGTIAEGAVLDIRAVPGDAWCRDCAQLVELHRRGEPCAGCAGYNLQVRAGTALNLQELEVE